MVTRVREMALNNGTPEEAAIRDLVDILRKHQAVLPSLPEILERLISNETSETDNFDTSREDEQGVLTKRKKADLCRRYKDEMAEKDERITQLESELHEKTMELERLSKDKEEEVARWKNYHATIEEVKKSNDEHIKEAEDKEKKLKQLTDRIASLESELKSKDRKMDLIKAGKEEQIQECEDRSNKLKGQYEEATSGNDQKLKELNFRIEDLTKQISNKEDQVKEYETKCNKLIEELNVLLANIDDEKTRYSELKERCKVIVERKNDELKNMETRNKDLTQQIRTKEDQVKESEAKFSEFKERCKVYVERKDDELRKMKTRLAHLSEKQAQRDQRKIEDTTSCNRPSEVEKDFTAFFDDERMDACEKMQEVYGSEEESEVGIAYPRLACMIFETAYEEMKETKEAVLTLFKVISKSMIDLAPTMGAEYVSRAIKGRRLPYNIPFTITAPYRPELEYSIDVFDALVLSLKETAHECDLKSLEQGVEGKIREKWLQWLTKEKSCRFSFSEHLLAQLNDYIKACIRLTWRMVTQVPPMQLEYHSPTLSKDNHKNLGYHCSPEMRSSCPAIEGQASVEELEIACYLWPTLLDGGGKLIRAGEVVCKVKEEITKV